MTYEEFLLMLALKKRERIKAGSITEIKIAEKSVTLEKISESTITEIRSITQKTIVEEKTDNYSVLKSDFGKLLIMSNANTKTFFLPSVYEDDIGSYVKFARIDSGDVIIKAADTDMIDDSLPGGSIHNDLPDELNAEIILCVRAVGKWILEAPKGVGWRTT